MIGEQDRRPIIDIRNVEHWFNDKRSGKPIHAVRDVSLSIYPREFVSIVGPSGCGKTTLLNIVSGLATPTRGSVSVQGKPVTGIQPRMIGYMFARDTLMPWRSTIENVEFGLEIAEVANRRQTALEFLGKVGLGSFADAFPDQLSHGMRQRTALARTLAASPSILLMDEPFGTLDAQTKLLMEEAFIKIWEADQKTVMFVTHDLAEAVALSDRVLVMSARPCRLKAEYKIDLPRPRDTESLQKNALFNEIVAQLWHDLKEENLSISRSA